MGQNFYEFLVDNDIVGIARRPDGEWFVYLARPATSAEKTAHSSQAIGAAQHVAIHK